MPTTGTTGNSSIQPCLGYQGENKVRVNGEKEKRLVAASVMAGIEVECADWHTIKVRHGNEFVRCVRAQGCKLAGSVTCEKCKQVGSMRSYTKALLSNYEQKAIAS